MKIEKIIELYPRLYHMAECESWTSIQKLGLLSTSAILDYFEIADSLRLNYEVKQRAEKMKVPQGRSSGIVLRDQKPMPKERLAKALRDGITPEDWYKIINNKVFFWAAENRLLGLLNARAYRDLEHDVLTIDTAPFVEKYAQKIWLCHMNSGNTWPIPHARGKDTFQRITNYPSRYNGNPIKPVAELVVDYSVPDISNYVLEVRRMKGDQVISQIL